MNAPSTGFPYSRMPFKMLVVKTPTFSIIVAVRVLTFAVVG